MSSVLGIAGGVVQAFGQLYEAGSKANVLRSQADATKVAGTEQEADAEFQAQFTEQQSTVQQDQIKRYGERITARANAIAAASGVDPGGGSVVLAAMDNAANIETDVMRTKFSSDLRAGQLRWQGSVARATADFNAAVLRKEAGVIQTIGDISALSTALSSSAIAYQNSQGVQPPAAATQPYGTTSPSVGSTSAAPRQSAYDSPSAPQTLGDTTGQSLLWNY